MLTTPYDIRAFIAHSLCAILSPLPATSDVDEILDGMSWGWYQKRHFLHISYTWIVSALITMNFVFVSPSVVKWRCVVNNGVGKLRSKPLLNVYDVIYDVSSQHFRVHTGD